MQRKSRSLLVLLILTLCMSTSVHGQGIAIEPWIGYEAGELDYGPNDDDGQGLVYGLRLAYFSGRMGVGIEYGAGSVEIDSEPEDHFEFKDMGGVFIYNLRAARVWASYLFDAKGELDNAGESYGEGSGYRFGVGFFVMGRFFLNIEKVNRKYKKLDSVFTRPPREMDSLVFSLTVPLF